MADFDLTSTPVTRPKTEEEVRPPIFGEGIDLTSAPIGRVERKAEEIPDLGRATASGLMKMPLAVAGMAGDIEELIKISPMLGVQAYDWARGKMGIPRSEEEKTRGLETARRMSGYIGERQEKGPLPGLGVPYTTPPTTEEMASAVQPYAYKKYGVGPATEFKLPQESITQEAVTGVGSGLVGPFRGMLRRSAAGAAGAGTSEAAGQYAKGTELEIPARLAGAVTGVKAVEKLAPFSPGRMIPQFGATERLASTLGDYGAESSAAARRMSQTPGIAGVAAETPERMRQFTQNITGINPRSVEYTDYLEEIGRIERNRVYDVARSMPNAGAISDPAIDALRSRPIFQKAESLATKRAADLPDWDIQPPVSTPGTPQGKWVQTPQGLQFQGPQNAIPPSVTPGNLNYYDQVKKELDGIMEQAKRTGDTETLVAARKTKEELLGVLDPLVPEYRVARGIAADTFRAASAPEAGARFLTTFDEFDKKQFTDAFRTYTPDQKRAFAVGMMGQLEDDLIKNPKKVAETFLKRDFFEKMELAFGREGAQAIRAKALSENLLQQANRIRENAASAQNVQAAKTSAISSGTAAAGTTAGIIGGSAALAQMEPLMQLLVQLGVPRGTTTAALIAGGVVGTTAATFNSIERRIAKQMVNLASSTDPRSFARINKLIDEHPQVYNKLITPMVAINTALEKGREENRGGRIARQSGGRISSETEAERLIRAAESAKKNIGKGTEEILNAPDEHVVKALKVANEQFEG
jgi:hypothetical protein